MVVTLCRGGLFALSCATQVQDWQAESHGGVCVSPDTPPNTHVAVNDSVTHTTRQVETRAHTSARTQPVEATRTARPLRTCHGGL